MASSFAHRRSRFRLGSFTLRSAHALPLLGLLLAGPALYLGGAPAASVPLWASVALLALFLTGGEWRSLRRDPLVWAALVLLGVSALQLVPLPPALLRWLSPRSAELSADALRPLGVDRSGAWRALHLDPGNGLADVHYLVGLLAAYLAARQATVRRYGPTILAMAEHATLWVSIVALAHKALDLDKVYSVYAPVEAHPALLSPLLNSNHLAAFAGVGAVLWAGRSVQAPSASGRVASASASVVCGATCALSLSRGGIAAALAGVTLLVLGLSWARNERRRHSAERMFWSAGVLGLIVAVALFVAWEALRAEYATRDLTKLQFSLACLRALGPFALFGTGSGGLHVAMAQDGRLPGNMTVERAESLPIDLAAAVGPAAALAILALGLRWLWCNRPVVRTGQSPTVAAYCAVISVALHDLVDFSLWLGATGYLTAILAGLVAGEGAAGGQVGRGPHRSPALRAAFGLAMLASLAAGLVTARAPLAYERDQFQQALAAGVRPARLEQALVWHPGDAYLTLVQAAIGLRTGDRHALRFVNRALQLAPNWAEPHVMLVRALRAWGLRSQALTELRHAASLPGANRQALAQLLANLEPTEAQFDRAIPPGALGVEFLRVAARQLVDAPLGPHADALLLSRAPDDLDALGREARRARERRDLAAEGEFYQRMVRSHPRRAEGYVGLSRAALAAGDLEAAEAAARRGIAQAEAGETCLLALAEVQVVRRDTAGMRRTMQQMMELVGGDIDRRINVFGLLGHLERRLGHEAAALGAFERGDAMAFPQHPYLVFIIQLAHQLNDDARLRASCATMADEGIALPAVQRICERVRRASPTPPSS